MDALLNFISDDIWFWSGVVALISGFLARFIARLPFRILSWVLAVAMPYGVAYCGYWVLANVVSQSGEYSSWAALILTRLYLAGLFVSLLVFVVSKED